MAAGDFYIRRNNAETSTLPNAGANLDATWDTLELDEGSAATYSAGVYTISNIGPHLILYSERFYTSDTTNNERIEGQGRLRIGGVDVVEGAAEGYIRKTSGQQDMVISGACIYRTTGINTSLITRFSRGDDSTTGTVTRASGFGGVQIFQLDDANSFARYSTTATQTLSTTEAIVTNWTNDEEDVGFSRTADTVTISSAGRYVMSVSGTVSITGTSRTEGVIFAKNTSVAITGSRGSFHMRGLDGCQNGAFNVTMIIDVAANDTITLHKDLTGGSTPTIGTGMVWQFWKLPAGSETAIMEATTGDMNTPGAFTWDTLPQIDTLGFTATAGTSNIDVDQNCHLIAFWQMGKTVVDSVQRAYPMSRVTVNSNPLNYVAGGSYHRNSGGIGAFMSQGASSIVPNVASGRSIEIEITPLAASGVLDCDTGHFSLLNLESIFTYTYSIPPEITDFNTTEVFDWGDTGLIITGSIFGATQGVGKVEFWSDTAGTIKTSQTVNSWSATSISIDTVQGSLSNNSIVYLVVTTNSALESNKLLVTVGLVAYSALIVSNLKADHYWRFNNTMADTGDTGPARDMLTEIGTTTYSTGNIVDDNTHALILNEITERIGPADSPNMNITIDAQQRTLCAWIQLNSIQHPLGCIFKEGAQIQNMAFLAGYGNIILAQMADTPSLTGNVQAWSDYKLTVSRPYHICMRYDYPNNFELFVDGKLQANTDGNPLGVGTFNSHSGDIAIGSPDTTLETGGTDLTYGGMENMLMSDFASWSDNSAGVNAGAISNSDIKELLFRRGALPNYTVATAIQATMQTDVTTNLDNTTVPDYPLGVRINKVTGNGNVELTFTNVVFDSRVTDHIEYRGGGTITLVNRGTSNIVASQCFSPAGGTISVVNDVSVTITVKDIKTKATVQNAFVLLKEDPSGVELIKTATDVNGQVTVFYRYGADQAVIGVVRKGTTSPLYKESVIADTIISSGLDITIFMISDE